MRTVLIDNSLCVYTLKDNASEKHIYEYIEALRDAGVRYVEVDFRTVMKLHELPKGIGYVFRLIDPMFIGILDVFDFNYLLITPQDLKKDINSKIPIMLECPAQDCNITGKIVRLAQHMVDGKITAVRLRGSFPMIGPNSNDWKRFAYANIMLPIDICPMNDFRTSLDTALKCTKECIDSITLTAGCPERYCSLEEYIMTLMTVFDSLPPNYDLNALCKASVYQKIIFRNGGGNGITHILNILDNDMQFLTNVDTGERVNLKAIVRTARETRRNYISALEAIAKKENMSDGDYEMIKGAVKGFDNGFFNREIMNSAKYRGFLN